MVLPVDIQKQVFEHLKSLSIELRQLLLLGQLQEELLIIVPIHILSLTQQIPRAHLHRPIIIQLFLLIAFLILDHFVPELHEGVYTDFDSLCGEGASPDEEGEKFLGGGQVSTRGGGFCAQEGGENDAVDVLLLKDVQDVVPAVLGVGGEVQDVPEDLYYYVWVAIALL